MNVIEKNCRLILVATFGYDTAILKRIKSPCLLAFVEYALNKGDSSQPLKDFNKQLPIRIKKEIPYLSFFIINAETGARSTVKLNLAWPLELNPGDIEDQKLVVDISKNLEQIGILPSKS